MQLFLFNVAENIPVTPKAKLHKTDAPERITSGKG